MARGNKGSGARAKRSPNMGGRAKNNNQLAIAPATKLAGQQQRTAMTNAYDLSSSASGIVTAKGVEFVREVKANLDTELTAQIGDEMDMKYTRAKRLKYLSAVYDYWRPKHIKYHYRPRVGTTEAGRVTIVFDRGLPMTITDYTTGSIKVIMPAGDAVYNFQPLVSGPVWQNMHVVLPLQDIVTRKWYSTRPKIFGQVGNSDATALPDESNYLGTLYYQTTKADAAISYGDIWIEYEIEFCGPVAPPVTKQIHRATSWGSCIFSGAQGGGKWSTLDIGEPYRIGNAYGEPDKPDDRTKIRVGVGYEWAVNPATDTAEFIWKGPHTATFYMWRGASTTSLSDFKGVCTTLQAAFSSANYSVTGFKQLDWVGWFDIAATASGNSLPMIVSIPYIDNVVFEVESDPTLDPGIYATGPKPKTVTNEEADVSRLFEVVTPSDE